MAGSRLPNETWTQIIGYLPHARQIPLLHVSRNFHDIAIRYIFSTVKIYFMGQEFREMYISPALGETIDMVMHQSWEILHHITQNYKFACVVKSIAVIALANSSSVFEKLCLGQALRAIPDLRTFYWFGVHPEFSQSLIECLPRSLQSLHVQSTPSSPWTSESRLGAIRHLRLETIFFNPRWTHMDDMDLPPFDDGMNPDNSVANMIGMSIHLRQLSLLSHYVGVIPMYVYSSLIELEICVPQDSDIIGMDLIFHHIPLLQSLSLVGYLTPEVLTLLPQTTTSLPCLTSFRISAEQPSLPFVGEEHITVLSHFLSNRTTLRRLYIRLASAHWIAVSNLLPLIRDLSGLEVLGFHAGCDCLDLEDVEALASALSPDLTGLHLAIPWNYPDSANIDINILSPLLFRLIELPHLEFLHLYGIGQDLPIDPEDLASELRQIQTIGFNRALWDVDGPELVRWKSWRVQSAIEEDFQCQDDAWLFKYH